MVNSSANTVASGSSVTPVAHRNCAPKWIALRMKCNTRRRVVRARMSAGFNAPNTSSKARPPPLRMASISSMCSFADSIRIDTAIAENDSSAPVIHKTTRTRSRCCTLLGVRLKVRARGVERGKLGCRSIDRGDAGKALERHLEASGVGNLRHDADVRERHVSPERIGSGPDQLLDRFEAGDDPVTVPFLDRALVRLEGVAQIGERSGIVERVDVAGDDLRYGAYPRPFDRVLRQQRRVGVDLIEIFDDGKRLQQHVAIVQREHRHPLLRIYGTKFRRMLPAAIAGQMNRYGLELKALEVQCDARTVGGRRTKVGIQFHVSSWAFLIRERRSDSGEVEAPRRLLQPI